MFTSLQATLLAAAVPLYALALCGMFLRWLRTRDEHCGRCGHPIAAGQSARCAECGAPIDTPRRRRFEPRWIRRVQLAIGVLSVASVVWVTHGVIGRPRLQQTQQWLDIVRWKDGRHTVLNLQLRALTEIDGSGQVTLDGVVCFFRFGQNDSNERRESRRFRIVAQAPGWSHQYLDATGNPSGPAKVLPTPAALAKAIADEGEFTSDHLARHFAVHVASLATSLVPATDAAASRDAASQDVVAAVPEIDRIDPGFASDLKNYRATGVAQGVATIIGLVCLLLLLPALFWRIDGIGARHPRSHGDDEQARAA